MPRVRATKSEIRILGHYFFVRRWAVICAAGLACTVLGQSPQPGATPTISPAPDPSTPPAAAMASPGQPVRIEVVSSGGSNASNYAVAGALVAVVLTGIINAILAERQRRFERRLREEERAFNRTLKEEELRVTQDQKVRDREQAHAVRQRERLERLAVAIDAIEDWRRENAALLKSESRLPSPPAIAQVSMLARLYFRAFQPLAEDYIDKVWDEHFKHDFRNLYKVGDAEWEARSKKYIDAQFAASDARFALTRAIAEEAHRYELA